jgi:ubiquinone/menaquinone biosynthesis C-methylase UbiE
MPEESMWVGFFEPERVLEELKLTCCCSDVVDFGCGYGTFTIPAARIVSGTVHALDIEPDMVRATQTKAEAAGLRNVRVCLRDFAAEGSGLASESVDYVMLFNILHAECPTVLLEEAFRVLGPGGTLGIIHWNYDPATPRGPSMDIRPRPEQCQGWAAQVGFRLPDPGIIQLPPYHYGMALQRP